MGGGASVRKREDDRALVVIHEASNSMVAGLLKSLLESAGIPAVVIGNASTVWDSLVFATPRVAVPARFADEAKEVIAACIRKAEDIGA